jgi:hypothetical protein
MHQVTVTEWGVRLLARDGTEHVTQCPKDTAQRLARQFPTVDGAATLVSRQATFTTWTPGRNALFPVPGARVTCGLRTDLPRAKRRHDWVSLGLDVRNCGAARFLERLILACRECGTDRAVAP